MQLRKTPPAGTLIRLVNSRSTITSSHVQNDTGTVSKFIHPPKGSYFTKPKHMYMYMSHFAQTFVYKALLRYLLCASFELGKYVLQKMLEVWAFQFHRWWWRTFTALAAVQLLRLRSIRVERAGRRISRRRGSREYDVKAANTESPNRHFFSSDLIWLT